MTHLADHQYIALPSDLLTRAINSRAGDKRFLDRFNSKIDFGFEPEDCHIWLGALSDEGYGNFWVGRHTARAHRVAYILRFGAPDEETPFLDHVNCLGRFCVNPRHLEPVDNAENTRRGRGLGKGNQRVLRSAELQRRAALRAAGREEIFW